MRACRVKTADGEHLKHDALRIGAELTIYWCVNQ